MASLVLKSNYSVNYKPNLTAVPVDLRYDPENGNVELVQQGLGGQVLYKNGEFTDQGNATIQVNETGTVLEASISNDVRAAATRVDGKIQSWAQNPNTENPNPRDRGPESGSTSGISTTYDVSGSDTLVNELENFGDPNNFSRLSTFLFYPENIAASKQDTIVITQYEYVPAPIANANTVADVTNAFANRDAQFVTQKGFKGQVILPMPNDISEANQTGWGEDSLSSISGALMANAGKLAEDVAGGKLAASIGTLGEMVGKLGSPEIENRLKRFLVTNAAASILKLGNINVNPEAYITRVTGAAINPNLELLFNGPKLRQFGFQFKMTPRNEKEAKHIRSIIKFFKKGMSPRRGFNEAQSIYLGTPNVFELKFKSSTNEMGSIGKIKTCALVSCGVNYTPDGFYAAYQDSNTGSQPIAVILSLGFTELTPVYNDEYDAEGDGAENSIGPDNLNKYEVITGEE